MGLFAVGNLHSIYIYFSVLLLEFCDINMVSHIPYTNREHHMGRHNLVHSNSSSNDIGRASYKFLMKKRTKIKIAVENKPQRSSVSNSFQRGEWFYILVSWLVWGCFFMNIGLPLSVYISAGVQQHLHNILFVYTWSDKSGNLKTVHFVNYSRCFGYLCIWAAWAKLRE